MGELFENTANVYIGRWLNSKKESWYASGERVGTIEGTGQRPDVIITEGDRMPVIVESEYSDKSRPGVKDATSRLGKRLVGETRQFTEVIALGINEVCKQDSEDEFYNRLAANQPIFTVQFVSRVDGGVKIWPDSPLGATPNDLIAYCEYAQVPQSVIDEQSTKIADGVESTGSFLLDRVRSTQTLSEETLARLREITGCEHNDVSDEDSNTPQCPDECSHDVQATRSACAIWLIAIDLQNDLAQYSTLLQRKGLNSTDSLKEQAASGRLTKAAVLKEWRIIAEVNYLPVIEIAIESLSISDIGAASSNILERLNDLSAQQNALHAKHVYNFAGELWQRLVGDREERAANYTKPSVAELLATLGVERFGHLSSDRLATLNLMDAACGTGTLISAGERALRRKYAIDGGEDLDIHRKRMENHIYAMDVNGIAGTLTAKRLTDLQVDQDYANSKVAVITDPAGSLILMDPTVSAVSKVLGYKSVTPIKGIDGNEGVFHVGPQSIQWSLMNPPYSRPRKGRVQATTGLESLRAKSKRYNYTMSHGQAGLATDFGTLTNVRLNFGGVYSHVLPFSAGRYHSWGEWRKEVEKDFENITVITNVSPLGLQSMSADTNIEEMLLVATKRTRRTHLWNPTDILYINLSAAPETMAEGYALAQEIDRIPTDAEHGFLTQGSYVRVKQEEAGFPWCGVGISNHDYSKVYKGLLSSQAYDPETLVSHDLSIPMVTLNDLCERGPSHHSIGHVEGNDPIGAFEWKKLENSGLNVTHKSLWRADASTQKTIQTLPTHAGNVVNPVDAKTMAQKRSRWFLSRNLRWTSQSLAFAKTDGLCHGGAGWNALQGLATPTGKCLALYYNSTFGAIVRSFYAASSVFGRARLQVKAIEGLPCPDFAADNDMSGAARQLANERFDELSALALRPFGFSFWDDNRKRIDDAVARMLGLDVQSEQIQNLLTQYRRMFVTEPIVHGYNRRIEKSLKTI